MAKKKKDKIEGKFVPLQHSLMTSSAFISLSAKAKIAYLYFLYGKRKEKSSFLSDRNPNKKYLEMVNL